MKIQRLLISGIPGTGKTFIGNYLGNNFNFFHFDMEYEENLKKFMQEPEKTLSELLTKKQNVVITGGFQTSESAFNLVKTLINSGFVFVWFEGNHDNARREFIKRNTVPTQLFDEKIVELKKNYSKIIGLKPIIINTFDSKNLFKKPEQLVKEITKR